MLVKIILQKCNVVTLEKVYKMLYNINYLRKCNLNFNYVKILEEK